MTRTRRCDSAGLAQRLTYPAKLRRVRPHPRFAPHKRSTVRTTYADYIRADRVPGWPFLPMAPASDFCTGEPDR